MAIEVVTDILASSLSNNEARRNNLSTSFDAAVQQSTLAITNRSSEVIMEHPNSNTYGASSLTVDPNTLALLNKMGA